MFRAILLQQASSSILEPPLPTPNSRGESALQALVPDFRPVMEAYFDGVLALGRRVLRLLALALDLPPTWCVQV